MRLACDASPGLDENFLLGRSVLPVMFRWSSDGCTVGTSGIAAVSPRRTVAETVIRTNSERATPANLVRRRREGRHGMKLDEDAQRAGTAMERFRERVQGEWRRSLVRALTEPARAQDADVDLPATPLDELAARAVADAWPQVDVVMRPIFEKITEANVERDTDMQPLPLPTARVPRAAWLGAEEVAPVLGMTAHTLRRLARTGDCPVVVRRIGGRWCFSRADLERLVDATR